MYTKKSLSKASKTFGVFFLLAFISYGFGSGIGESLTGSTIDLPNIFDNRHLLVLGVVSMAIIHSIVNIGLPVIMTPILKSTNKTLTYGYLSAGIAATVTLIIGAILLIMLVPLSEDFILNPANDSHYYNSLAILLTKGNFYAYQIGMALWGVGGLMFCRLLYVSKLVPKGFAIWGGFGYMIFIAGTVLELFGFGYGVQLALPGGLFEITLSFWLIFKGLDASKLATINAQ